jgi:hypothetical protein
MPTGWMGSTRPAFLRNQVPLTLTGAAAIDGVIFATNTGPRMVCKGSPALPVRAASTARTTEPATAWLAARTPPAGSASTPRRPAAGLRCRIAGLVPGDCKELHVLNWPLMAVNGSLTVRG